MANEKNIKQYSIGPFRLGQNSVQNENDRIFQLPDPEALFPDKDIPQLNAAVNVDIDNDGIIKRRKGLEEVLSATNALSAFSGAGLLLMQDGGIIKKIDLSSNPVSTTNVVTGLSSTARVTFYEFEDEVYYTNGIVSGRITNTGTGTNWGMSVPNAPTLTGSTVTQVGSEQYTIQVVYTYVDANGVESGASTASSITIWNNQTINCYFTLGDPNAVSVNIYATGADANGRLGLFYVGNTSSSPYNFSSYTTTYPLRTQFMQGPPVHDGIFSYKRTLMVFKDNWIYPSSPYSHHLFRVGHDAIDLPTTVQFGAGLENGFYVGTEEGLWWYSGNNLEDMTRVRIDNNGYAQGTQIISGKYIPEVKQDGLIALFVNEEGLVAGLPNGQIMPLRNDSYRIQNIKDKRATIVRREHEFTEGQILVRLW